MLFNQKEIIMPSSYVIKKSKETIKNTLVVTLILINYRGTAKKLNSTRQAAVVVCLLSPYTDCLERLSEQICLVEFVHFAVPLLVPPMVHSC